jgi:hypothetical protein
MKLPQRRDDLGAEDETVEGTAEEGRTVVTTAAAEGRAEQTVAVGKIVGGVPERQLIASFLLGDAEDETGEGRAAEGGLVGVAAADDRTDTAANGRGFGIDGVSVATGGVVVLLLTAVVLVLLVLLVVLLVLVLVVRVVLLLTVVVLVLLVLLVVLLVLVLVVRAAAFATDAADNGPNVE